MDLTSTDDVYSVGSDEEELGMSHRDELSPVSRCVSSHVLLGLIGDRTDTSERSGWLRDMDTLMVLEHHW